MDLIQKLCLNPDLGRFVECISGSTLLSAYLCCHSHRAVESVLFKEMALHASLKCLNAEVIAEDVTQRKAWCSKTTVLTPFVIAVILLDTKLWFLYSSLDGAFLHKEFLLRSVLRGRRWKGCAQQQHSSLIHWLHLV